MKNYSPTRKSIIAIYVAAVIVRIVLAFFFGDQMPQISDALDYDRLAVTLVKTGAYTSEAGVPISLRPPLYPVMVAGIYLVFGIGNYFAVACVQSIISMGTMILVHRLGSSLFGPNVGLFAAAVTGFYPSLLAFNCLVLSETLFTFFFVLAVCAAFRLLDNPDWKAAVLLGTALGLGALTRSILWVCAVPLLGYLALTINGPIRVRLKYVFFASTVFVVILAPWTIRNTRLHKTFTVVDVMGGRNVMMGNYEFTPLERSWATVTDVTGDRSWHRVLAADTPEYSTLTQGQIDKKAMRYGIRYFFGQPSLSLKRSIVRFFNFWQPDRTITAGVRMGLWGEVNKVTLILVAATFCGGYAFVIVTAIFGLLAAPLSWKQLVLVLLFIALPCAVHTAAFAHSRYHLPLMPILGIFAAYSVVSLRSDLPSPTRRVWVAGTILTILLMVGWLRELVMVDLANLS